MPTTRKRNNNVTEATKSPKKRGPGRPRKEKKAPTDVCFFDEAEDVPPQAMDLGGRRGSGEEGGGEEGGRITLTPMAHPGEQHINPPTTMIEFACPKRANYIANLTLEDYKPIASVSRQRQCQNDIKGSYKRVQEWALKHAESNLDVGVEFTYRFAAGKDFGRMTSNSMMGIPRDIRGFVCVSEETGQPVLTDLDMDNCHPVILQWLCEGHGIVCDQLKEYIAQQDKHKEDLMDSTGKSKEEVKSMFLAAVNAEHECWHANLTPFFTLFDKQCKAIQQAFMQLEQYKWVRPYAEKSANEKLEQRKAELRRDRKTTNGLTANIGGSFINLILCTWENRFLGAAFDAVTKLGLEGSVNNFDGLMIRGNHYPAPDKHPPPSKARDEIICPALEQALFDRYGITMGWSMKRHSTCLEYSGDNLKLPYSKLAELYLNKICRVGSEYVVDLSDGSTVTECGRKIGERFKGETAKCILGSKEWHARNSFAETLMRDPAMRTYEKADMYPDTSDCPATVYNLWKPMPCESWDVTKADPHSKNVDIFRRLVRVLADHIEDVANFIELYIAHMLHHPSRKPNAWLILMSEEGAGKGTLVKIIMLLVGLSKVKEINNVQRSLLGSFNQAMLDAFFVVLDEASGKHLFDGGDELKNMITAPMVPVNQKGVQEKNIRSYARFMCTCQPRSVPTKKGDRRGVISRCSDELIKDTAFWKDINARMDSETGEFIRDIHAYLITLKPPPVFSVEDLPQTDVQRELQAANADIFSSWIADVVERWLSPKVETMLMLQDYKGTHDRTNMLPEFIVDDLYQDFREFGRRSNASKLVEHITYQVFVSKFAICRWRKAFDYKPNTVNGQPAYPKHKISGMQKQCRRWDIQALARDLGIETTGEGGSEAPDAEVNTASNATAFAATKHTTRTTEVLGATALKHSGHPDYCSCRKCV